MTATIGLVLDCTDPSALARFWSEALGDTTTVGGAGNYVMLADPDGVRPKLLLQGVPEPKATKHRMHLDIERLGRRIGRAARDSGRRRWHRAAEPATGSGSGFDRSTISWWSPTAPDLTRPESNWRCSRPQGRRGPEPRWA